MSLKKVNYNTGEGIVKIKIEDSTGAKLENWTIMLSDLGKWANIICKKYGIDRFERKMDSDLDWAR